LQYTANTATHCNTLQHTATHKQAGAKEYLDDYYEPDFEDVVADMLTATHTATHCNALQYTATHCNIYTGWSKGVSR